MIAYSRGAARSYAHFPPNSQRELGQRRREPSSSINEIFSKISQRVVQRQKSAHIAVIYDNSVYIFLNYIIFPKQNINSSSQRHIKQ